MTCIELIADERVAVCQPDSTRRQRLATLPSDSSGTIVFTQGVIGVSGHAFDQSRILGSNLRQQAAIPGWSDLSRNRCSLAQNKEMVQPEQGLRLACAKNVFQTILNLRLSLHIGMPPAFVGPPRVLPQTDSQSPTGMGNLQSVRNQLT